MLRRDIRLAAILVATFGVFCLPLAPATAARKMAEQPAEVPQQQAGELIRKLGDRAIAILADKATSTESKKRLFQNLMHESFDLHTIGRFVLGRNAWHGATPEQKSEYMRLFEKLVIKIYSDRFALYSGQRFKVIESRPEGERDTMVVSQIVQPYEQAQPIFVDWRVRNFEGRMGIIDVVVEGISMSVTQRQEYGAVIQRNDGDIDELLRLMRDQLERQDAEETRNSGN